MRDREVRLTAVLAVMFWVAGFAIVLVAIATERNGIGGLGVLAGVIGGVLNVRGFVRHCEEQMRAVFEAGRHYERSQDVVRPVR